MQFRIKKNGVFKLLQKIVQIKKIEVNSSIKAAVNTKFKEELW
jgi:hypothetical protein